MPETLPEFDNPPLDETVIGLQFEPLKAFKVQQIMLYWNQIRENYPRVEGQLPLPHSVESETIHAQKFLVSLENATVPRCWFLNEPGTQLIQVQQDRFLRNWRRLQALTENYPRFDTLFGLFWKEWVAFRDFLKEQRIDEPKIDQCELTYVNLIDSEAVSGSFERLPSIFVNLRERERGFLPNPELFQWEARFPLPEGRGRLHVEAVPAFRKSDFKLLMRFNLAARGSPKGTTDALVNEWFGIAHEYIVRGFDELTTAEMHRTWKKHT
jgi:uncharacterized protein (TIGR04255 family)